VKTISDKIFNNPEVQNLVDKNEFASAADHLFQSQLKNWPLMKASYDALNNVQTKSFWYDGFKLSVQFNPGRIKSTSAVVDKNSVANRPCFLCIENLPEEQKGITIRNKFILLCNPYPILPQHFTIAALDHQPQAISEHFPDFLELSKMLFPKYTLIYNGPACGASAPDHLHFQAGTKLQIPIENDINQLKNDFGKLVHENELISVSFINDGVRRIMFIESNDQSLIEKSFEKILKVYEKFSKTKSEPMLNLICSYDNEFGWSLIIFLRRKHRPDLFFNNDPDKVLISPAAVDMGGLIITPREEDFNKINEKLIQQIINEVSLDSDTCESMIKLFKQT
jgi:ATP adenylyltransferase/5',5'''-P-1,P-4-tetraphosphate phosphorylase II